MARAAQPARRALSGGLPRARTLPAVNVRRDARTPAIAPETAEELQLRARIDALRAEIAVRSTELEELRLALAAFEARYDARVGTLLVALDRVELEAAVVRRRNAALRESIDAWERAAGEIEREFRGERERIDHEAREASAAGARARELPPAPPEEVRQSLRERYRRLARRFHPDVATTGDERAFNEQAMRRINMAMERNDLRALETLELQLPARELTIPGPTPGARVAWATAEIARLEDALARLAGELASERSGSLYELWQRSEQDATLLDRLERRLRDDLTAREMELHALQRDHDRLLGERISAQVLPAARVERP